MIPNSPTWSLWNGGYWHDRNVQYRTLEEFLKSLDWELPDEELELWENKPGE